MIIDTSEYKWSHGRKPRGRGSWAFQVAFDGCKRQAEIESVIHWSKPDQLYSVALREACKVARANGGRIVKVLP